MPDKVVLATRFAELGDVAMTIPALYDACVANPDSHIIMLTRASLTGLFINHPANLTVVGVDLSNYKGIGGMWRLMNELRVRYAITDFADLHDVMRTRIMRVAARFHGLHAVHIDKGRGEKKRLTRRSGKIMLPLTHTIDRYRATLAAAGVPAPNVFSSLFDSTHIDPAIYSAITQPKEPGEVWIGIAPFAKHEGKIYPVNLMEQVLRELSGRSNTTVFLFGGGPYEQKILGEWARKYPSTHSLAGKRYGFAAEMSLFHDLDAMISMDSANMHMSALAGAKVVAIWGATHPYCGFSGWKIPEKNNIHLPIPCRPCSVFGNKPCLTGDMRCLSSIKPNVITDCVDRIINASQA